MKNRLLPGASLGALALVALALLPCDRAIAGTSEPALRSFFPTNPDIRIQDIVDPAFGNDEMQADVAYNEDDDEFLVVFQWNVNGPSDHDIMAVTVSASGSVAPVIPIAYDAGYDDMFPAVARDPYNDSYLVVWQRRVGTGDFTIYGSIVGATVGAPFQITTWAAGQMHPDVAYATGSHHYLVVWEDYYPLAGGPPYARGRCVDQDGSMAGLNGFTISDYFGEQTYPAVATNGFDYTWLVAWKDTRDGDANIYGRQVSSLGACSLPTGSDFAIGTQTGSAGAPDVAWGQVDPGTSAYGEFLVGWGEAGSVYGQRINGSDYSLEGGAATISSHDSDKFAVAAVYAALSEEWWVVWADDRDYG